ncbi:MAG: glycine oxidase ThiO [Terriglobales bacterium]
MDVVIAGAGVIGMTLARELDERGFAVEVLEAGEPGREATWAAAGMLGAYQTRNAALRPLAVASARLYPSWVERLEAETGLRVGYRPSGTLVLGAEAEPLLEGWKQVAQSEVAVLEPGLRVGAGMTVWRVAGDHSVDNRALGVALAASLRQRGVVVRQREPVQAIEATGGGLEAVTGKGRYRAEVVINAAGAWAGAIKAPVEAPVRPRKGQMLCVRTRTPPRHVIEGPGVYLVPREDGRVLVGATLEDVGFDRTLTEDRLAELRQRAIEIWPALEAAPVESRWCGLRPGSSDDMPIIGPTRCPGYWLATGHYRDGILLAPLTAKIVGSALAKGWLTEALDLRAVLPERF